jgi:nucleotide-binding universal stress UspA family protein
MSLKSLLAVLDRPADMAGLLAWTSRLARDFDARADAAFARFDIAPGMAMFPGAYAVFPSDLAAKEIAAASDRAEAVAREEFETARRRGPRSRFDQLYIVSGSVRGEIARQARGCDLTSAHLPDAAELVAGSELLGDLLMLGGAPIFAAPRGLACDAPLQTALIAWDESLESSRAVRAALPFLKECRIVYVRTVEEKKDRSAGFEGIVRYLSRHGVEADCGMLKPGEQSVGRLLLDEADRLAADFIVLGAFGRAPWREQLFGGATQTAISEARKALILAR